MKKYFFIMIFFTLIFTSLSYAHHKTTGVMIKTLDQLLNNTEFEEHDKMSWINREEKTQGSIILFEGFRDRITGLPCREFRLENVFQEQLFRAKGVLCLSQDGIWGMVDFKTHPDNPEMKKDESSAHKHIPNAPQYEVNNYSY